MESGKICHLNVQGIRSPRNRGVPLEGKVKPDPKRSVMKPVWRVVHKKAQGNLNISNRPVRTRMPGGVGGERPLGVPYPDQGMLVLGRDAALRR